MLKKWKQWRQSRKSKKQQHLPHLNAKLGFEELEARRLLSASPLLLSLSTSGPNDVTVRRDGSDIWIYDTSSGATLARRDLASTSQASVQGATAVNDIVRIDYGGGAFGIPLSVDGGAGGGDELNVSGAAFQSVRYGVSGYQAGSMRLDAETITFTGLEATTDSTIAAGRQFDLSTLGGSISQQLRIAGASPGNVTLDDNSSNTWGSRTFAMPTGSLSVMGGDGATAFTLSSLNLGAIPLSILGKAGNDTLVVRNDVTGNVSFDGAAGVNTVVNSQAPGVFLAGSNVQTTIDRPLLFIPGFGGTGAKLEETDGYKNWLLTRGASPDDLALEPLSNTYSDIVQTFRNVGFNEGSTFFTVLWDWRVPVAVTNDGTNDGYLADVTEASLASGQYKSGLHYLAHYLQQAIDQWQALTGGADTEVDFVTHSTGGLVARSYLQSEAYAAMPQVHNLVQVGVPNQGAFTPLNPLLDNFGDATASRLLGSALRKAYDLVMTSNAVITGPNGDEITKQWILDQPDDQRAMNFIRRYVATFSNLMGIYPDIAQVANVVGGNPLLSDLNASGQATGFVSKTDHTTIVYGKEADTPTGPEAHTGFDIGEGFKNFLVPFNDLLGHLPGSTQNWYTAVNAAGDGTVPYVSSAQQFENNPAVTLLEITKAAARVSDPIEHTGLVNNPFSQTRIVQAITGEPVATSFVSTDLLLGTLAAGKHLVQSGVINPLDYIDAAMEKVKGFVGDIQDRVDPYMDQTIPGVDKSIRQLMEEVPGYGFFSKIASYASSSSNSDPLDTVKTKIRTLLGLAEDEFDIVISDSTMSLVFSLEKSGTFEQFLNLNLGGAGKPVQASVPLDLELQLHAKFTLSVDFGMLLADVGNGDVNPAAIGIHIDQLTFGAILSSDDIDAAATVSGLGTLTITNGSASVGAFLDISLDDLTLADLTSLHSPQEFVSLFDVAPSLEFHLDLPVSTQIGTSTISLSGDARLIVDSPDLLTDSAPDITLTVHGGVLSISNYVYVAGNFGFQIGQNQDLLLQGATETTEMSMIQAGTSDVSIFVGTGGPYFQDSNNDGVIDPQDEPAATGARGFVLNNGFFGLALMKDLATDAQYYALKAGGDVSLVGMPSGFSLDITDLEVQVNGAIGGAVGVVDLLHSFPETDDAPAGLQILTGDEDNPVYLDFENKFLQVGAMVDLTVAGQKLSGHFTFTDDDGDISVAVEDVGFELNAGAKRILAVGEGSGLFTIGNGGIVGDLSLTILEGPDFGDKIVINRTKVEVAIDSAAGDLLIDVSGTDDAPAGITVFGNSLTAQHLRFEKSGDVVSFLAEDLELQLKAGGTTILHVGGDANFTFSSEGLVGAASLGLITPFSFGGMTLELEEIAIGINTTTTDAEIEWAGDTLELGADSLFVSLTGASLSFASLSLEVSSFRFEKTADLVSVDAEGLTLTVGSDPASQFILAGAASFHFDDDEFVLESASLGANELALGSFLKIVAPTISVSDMTFKKGDSSLTGSIQIEAEQATLFEGKKFSASIAELDGSYDFGTGAFSLGIGTFDLVAGTAFTVHATGIQIDYDPNNTDADQQIVAIESGTIAFPKLFFQGEVHDLLIRKNGFAFESLTVTDTSTAPRVIGPLSVKGLQVKLDGFDVTFGDDSTPAITGGLTVSAATATIGFKSLSASLVKPSTTFQFVDGELQDFQFSAETTTFQVASLVKIVARGTTIDTGATGTELLASFDSIEGEVGSGSMKFGATVSSFGFLADGSFQAGQSFRFDLQLGGANGSTFKWPTWLPIQINEFGISWSNFASAPQNFVISISASVDANLFGMAGVRATGTVQGLKIDIEKLVNGQFPIIDVGAVGVSVRGNMFGGTVDGALVAGIVKIDQNDELIPDGESPNPEDIKETIIYGGLRGGFSMAGAAGFSIQIGLSELGPLEVLMSASLPTGILIEPITGLTINDFVGGVTFKKGLPTAILPEDLRGPEFALGKKNQSTPTEWLNDLKKRVLRQYVDSLTTPVGDISSYFLSPITISGSAKIYSSYVSKQAFNGQLDFMISTPDLSNPNPALRETGPKFYASGKLNFALDKISMSARLYADLSHVDQGDVKVLFLADVPDQMQILTLKGVLEMGFVDDQGNTVTAPTPTIVEPTYSTTEPTADLGGARPNGGVVEVSDKIADQYVDIAYRPSLGHVLDENSIIDDLPEFTLSGPGVAGVTLVNERPTAMGNGVYRYKLSGNFKPGKVNLQFIAGSWSEDNGTRVSAAQPQQSFDVFAEATNFRIHLGSPLEAEHGTEEAALVLLKAPGLSSPLVQIEGSVDVTFDLADGLITLDMTGDVSLYYLGNVGRAGGHFVLDLNYDKPSLGSSLFGSRTPALWGVLEIQADLTALEQYGITVNADALIQINTTGQTQTETITLDGVPKTFQLAPLTFAVAMAGELVVEQNDEELFRMDGAFFAQIDVSGLQMFALADLKIGSGDDSPFDFNAMGLLIINQQGLAASMNVSLAAGNGGDEDFELTGDFDFAMNTTEAIQSFAVPDMILNVMSAEDRQKLGLINDNRTLTISAGPPLPSGSTGSPSPAEKYFVIEGEGSLDIKNEVELSGHYRLEITTGSIEMSGTASMTVSVLGTMSGAVAFRVDENGLVGVAQLTLGTAPTLSGVDLDLNFFLSVNTTGHTAQLETYTISTTDPTYGQVSSETSLQSVKDGIYLKAGGQLKLGADGAQVVLAGQFTFGLSSTELSVEAEGRVQMGVLGNLDVHGSFNLTSSGVVASLVVSANANLGDIGLRFSGYFQLEINTTSSSPTVQRLEIDRDTGDFLGYEAGQLSPHSAQLIVGGRLAIDVGDIDIDLGGTFTLAITSTYISVGINASLDFFGAKIHIDKTAKITAPNGIILNESVTVPRIDVPGLVVMQGTFTLCINTTSSAAQGVAAHSAFFDVRNFHLGFFNDTLVASGSAKIGFENGGFSINVPQNDPLHLNFFNLGTFNVWGYLNPDRQFEFHLTADFSVGSDQFGGEAHVTTTINNQCLFGTYSVTGKLAGIDIATFNGSLTIQKGGVQLYVHAEVVIFPAIPHVSDEQTLSFSHTFTIGTIVQPVEPVLASPANGNIRLNVGVNSTSRGSPYLADTSENFKVSSVPGGIRVNGLGFSHDYFGFNKIVVPNTNLGNDFIEIGSDVFYDAELTAGTGNDTLRYLGTGNATFNGGPGDATFTGGSGTNVYNLGSGSNIVYGGSGNDTVYWDLLDGPLTYTGGAGNDRLVINALTPGQSVTVSRSSDKIIITIGAKSLTISGVETVDLNLAGGGTFTAFDLSGTSIGRMNVNLGVHSQPVNIAFQGSANTDIYTFASEGETLRVDQTGAPSIAFSGAVVGDALAVYGNGSNDKIDAGSVGTTKLALSIFGGAGNDLLIGSAGADILHGGAGDDTLIGGGEADAVYGDADNDSLTAGYGTVVVDGGSGVNSFAFDDSNGSNLSATLNASNVSAVRNGVTKLTPFTNVQSRQFNFGGGTNALTVFSGFEGPTTIQAGNAGGTNDVFLRSTSNATNIKTLGDGFTVRAGNIAHTLAGVLGTINVDGTGATGATKLVVDGTGVTSGSASLRDIEVSGLGLVGALQFKALGTVEVRLGAGGSQAAVELSHSQAAAYVVQGNVGNDTFTIKTNNDPANVTINAGSGADIVNVETRGTSVLTIAANGEDGNDTFSVTTMGNSSVQGTLNGGANSDSVIMSLANPNSTAIATDAIESVTANLASTANAIWLYDNNSLTANSSQTVLTTAKATDVALKFSNAGAINIQRVSVASKIETNTTALMTIGNLAGTGATLSDITAPLTVSGSNGTLQIADKAFGSSSRSLTLSGNTIVGFKDANAITYQNFAALNVALGTGNDIVNLAGAAIPVTLDTADGADTVNITGGTKSATISLGDQLDTVNIMGGTGNVIIDGQVGGAKVLVDLRSRVNALTGTLGGAANGSDMTLTGLSLGDLKVTNLTQLDVKLGDGNDTFTIDSQATWLPLFALDTGKGNDTVIAKKVGSVAQVSGSIGDDNVTLSFSAAITPFPKLSFNDGVERLIVDNVGYASNVDWTVSGGELKTASATIVNLAGIGTTQILGGAGRNSLTVSSNSAGGVSGTIDADRVELIDGQQALDFADKLNNNLNKTYTMPSGLQGASAIAATTDGQYIYVVGKFGDAVTVFRRTGAGSQLQYVQTLTNSPNSDTSNPGANVLDAWRTRIQASAPVNWYRFDDTTTIDVTTQTMQFGNYLYALSQSSNTLRVFGKDGNGAFTVLLQKIDTKGNPVSMDANEFINQYVYVLNHDSNGTYLTSYNRDVNTGLLSFDTDRALPAVLAAPTSVRVNNTGNVQVAGLNRHVYTFTRGVSDTLQQIPLSQSPQEKDLSDSGGVTTAVYGMDIGRGFGMSAFTYYGADLSLKIFQGSSFVTSFPITGIRDVRSISFDKNVDQDLIAVSRQGELRIYSREGGTWYLLDTITGADPQQLAWAKTSDATPKYMLYATTSDGGIVVYQANLANGDGISTVSRFQFNVGPTLFQYGQPKSLRVSPDGATLYASTDGDAVVYVLNVSSTAAPTLRTVLVNKVVDYGSAQINGELHNGIQLGQTSPLDGAAGFNGVNSFMRIGAADLGTEWTAEFVLTARTGGAVSSDLLSGALAALKLDQYPGRHQIGYTKFGSGDLVFSPGVATPIGQRVHLTFVGSSAGVSLYVNGVLAGSNSATIALPRTILGALANTAPDAVIDEVMIYARALPATEIRSHVQSVGLSGELNNPNAVVVSPDNKFVYVAEGGISSIIQTYAIDATSGRLTYQSSTNAGLLFSGNVKLGVGPGGASLYAVGHTGLVWFQRNPTTGALTYRLNVGSTPLTDIAVSAATSAFGTKYVAVSDTANDQVHIFSIEGNGSLIPANTLSVHAPTTLEFSPDGRHLAVGDSSRLFGIQLFGVNTNGVPVQNSQVDSPFTVAVPADISFSADSQFVYATDAGNNSTSVYRIGSGEVLFNVTGAKPGLAGAAGILASPDGKTFYAVGSSSMTTGTLMAYELNATTGLPSSSQTFTANGSVTVNLTDLRSVTASGDGKVVYALAPNQNAIVRLDGDMLQRQVLLNGIDGELGLQGATSMVLSTNGRFLYVINPALNSVSVFDTGRKVTDTNLGNLTLVQTFSLNGLVTQGSALAVSANGRRLLASGFTGIAALAVNTNSGLLSTGPSMGGVLFVDHLTTTPTDLGGGIDLFVGTDSRNGSVRLFQYLQTTNQLQQITAVFQGDIVNNVKVEGLAGAAGVALSADGRFIYVTSPVENSVTAFEKVGSQLRYIATYKQGQNGIRGMSGASAVTLLDTAYGHFVVVAGTTDNSLAVFSRNASTGTLLFSQSLRDGSAGTAGLVQANSLNATSDSQYLFVASSAGSGASRGGVAKYSNLAFAQALPAPAANVTIFDKISTLTVATGSGDDNLLVRAAPTLNQDQQLLINTNAGFDSLVVNGLPRNSTLDLGDQDDSVIFRFANSSIQSKTLGGAGNDSFTILAAGSNANLEINGGLGADEFQVAMTGIPTAAHILLNGGDAGVDHLRIDAGGFDASPSAPNNEAESSFYAVNTNGVRQSGRLEYNSMGLVDLIAPPAVSIAGNPNADEGGPLVLHANVTSPSLAVSSIEWDINGDGVFGDTLGADVTLSWQQLVALGLKNDNNGVKFPIAVRATNAEGTGYAVHSVLINNKMATVALSGNNSVGTGVPYVLNFNAVQETNEPILGWLIQWGDNTPEETLGSTADFATHVYYIARTANISVRVITEDGTSVASSKSVSVANIAPTIGTFTVQPSGLQGTAASFSADATDTNPQETLSYSWQVKLGSVIAATSQDSTFSFTPLKVGSYIVSLTVRDSSGLDSAPKQSTFVVANVLPTISLIQTSPFVEGQDGTIAVSASDAGGVGEVLKYEFDFDNNGNFVVAPSGTATHRFASDGVRTVNVRVTDSNQGSTTTSLTINVLATPAIVHIGGDTNVSEGQDYTLHLSQVTPVEVDPIEGWTIQWGDGVTQMVAPGQTSVTHRYCKEGTYEISASVKNEDGTYPAQETVVVAVANVPPEVRISGLGIADEGLYTLALSFVSFDNDLPEGWIVNWGDGSDPQMVIGNPSALTHRYGGPSEHQITAIAINDGIEFTSNTLTVTTRNVAPTVESITQEEPLAKERTPVTLAVSASDAGNDRLTYSFDFNNDGIYETSNLTGVAQHVFADGGSYQVNVLVSDGQGGSVVSAYTVQVADIAPSLVLSTSSNGTAYLGDAVQINLTFQGDDADAIVSYSVNWGDGAIVNYSVAQDGLHPTHTYAAAAEHTITVFNVSDVRNNFGTLGIQTMTIRDLPPTLKLVGPSSVLHDVAYTLTLGDFVAPASTPVNLFVIDWNDGQTTVVNHAPIRGEQYQHAYDDASAGMRTIRVTMYDSNGKHLSAPLSVEVIADTPPVASAGGPYVVNEGGSVILSALASTDADQAANTLSYAWDLDGDGQFDDATGYAPTFSAIGLDGPSQVTVWVQATDMRGHKSVASGVISVRNVAPQNVQLTGAASFLEGTTPTFQWAATDPAGLLDTLSITWALQQNGVTMRTGSGSASVATAAGSSGSFSLPASLAKGTYTIRITVLDGEGGETIQSRTFTVANAAPTVGNIAKQGTEDVALSFAKADFEAGFSDPGNDPLTKIIVRSLPTNGTLKLNGVAVTLNQQIVASQINSLSFVPNADWNGQTSFRWQGHDGIDASAADAVVNIAIASVNDAPIAVGDAFVGVQNTTLTGNVLTNDSDLHAGAASENNAPLTAAVVNGPSKAFSFNLAANGTFTYVPAVGFQGVDQFTYRTIDSLGAASLPVTVTITVGASNLPVGITVVGDVLFIIGSSANDWVSVAPQGSSNTGSTGIQVQATLNNTWVTKSFTQSFRLIHIEVKDGNDSIEMTSTLTVPAYVSAGKGNNYVKTARGNDTVLAENGNNSFFTDGGNDTIEVGDGNNYIDAGDGDNKVTVGNGHLGVKAGTGYDIVIAGNGNHSIDVGNGGSVITVGNGNHWISAGTGNDVVTAGNGNQSIDVKDGDDIVVVGHGNSYVNLGAGNDSATLGNGNASIDAGEGDDYVIVGNGNTYVNAGAGNDQIRLAAGNMTVDAGDGNDTIVTGKGNSYVTGGRGNDVIQLGDGNQNVDAGEGDDIVSTGSGNNYITAGAGNDYVIGGAGNDQIDGGDGNDVLLGGAGKDTITGGKGHDLLIGGTGADRLEGGDGNDILVDGDAIAALSGDSLAMILFDWVANNGTNSASLYVRLAVTKDAASRDELYGNAGADWFWFDNPSDVKDATSTERKN
jgi:6-phosphogluconolactonase (cycloisomerase 2 family)/Ca2+-binding RTX toxin-like protein